MWLLIESLLASLVHILIIVGVLFLCFLALGILTPAMSRPWERLRRWCMFMQVMPFSVVYLLCITQLNVAIAPWAFLLIATIIKAPIIPSYTAELSLGGLRLKYALLLDDFDSVVLRLFATTVDMLFVVEVFLRQGIFYEIRVTLLRRMMVEDALMYGTSLMVALVLVGVLAKIFLRKVSRSICLAG